MESPVRSSQTSPLPQLQQPDHSWKSLEVYSLQRVRWKAFEGVQARWWQDGNCKQMKGWSECITGGWDPPSLCLPPFPFCGSQPMGNEPCHLQVGGRSLHPRRKTQDSATAASAVEQPSLGEALLSHSGARASLSLSLLTWEDTRGYQIPERRD